VCSSDLIFEQKLSSSNKEEETLDYNNTLSNGLRNPGNEALKEFFYIIIKIYRQTKL
jgi:hypothetical protein